MMQTPEEIGSCMAAMRKYRGLTQEAVRLATGITNATLVRMETGTTEGGMTTYRMLTDIYDCTLGELIGEVEMEIIFDDA